MPAVHDVSSLLATVTAALPAAEDRPGQRAMAEAIDSGLRTGRHVIVQAGTGTGKTMGYLVPAIVASARAETKVVVATATKALQDQLATKDLPFLTEHMPVPFTWAVLKGRSNYLCLQRLRELHDDQGQGQLELDDLPRSVRADVDRLALWAGTTKSGDLGELAWSPSDQAQRAVTVSGDECPGATRCPMGQPCFAERARREAQAADVVVVNLNLYGLDVASDGVILPEHDVVVIDEAHKLEDVMSDTVGVQIAAGRFASLAAALRRVVDDPMVVAGVFDSGSSVKELLAPHSGRRLPTPFPLSLQHGLVAARSKVQAAQDALRAIPTDLGAGLDDVKQRVLRAQSMATRLQEHIDLSLGAHEGYVAFVSGSADYPRLEVAPLSVGAILDKGIWSRRTAILTSATIPTSLSETVGIGPDRAEQLDVGSPFDYASQGLLYCATHLPDPRSPAREAAVHEEIAALVRAAGGRTLALFTSWKAMDAAAVAVKAAVDVPVITQRDLPKGALIEAFSADESTCLFATAGFFQGVDIPGRTLSLVIIDRIPFPRPDDPLLSARRELLGQSAFGAIDLPRASILLAQAAGRLVRTKSDRGVVAVLDPRLATASYRWRIIEALPPMRRTRHRADAEAFLRDVALQPL